MLPRSLTSIVFACWVQLRSPSSSKTVSDNGVGIAEKDIAKSLTPFMQVGDGEAHDHLGSTSSGSGLGLPLAKSLSELHGASFSLTSEVGVGTTVRIEFPADRVVDDTGPAHEASAA